MAKSNRKYCDTRALHLTKGYPARTSLKEMNISSAKILSRDNQGSYIVEPVMSLVGHQCIWGICGDTNWGNALRLWFVENKTEWMSWSHRSENANSDYSVMRKQSKAM